MQKHVLHQPMFVTTFLALALAFPDPAFLTLAFAFTKRSSRGRFWRRISFWWRFVSGRRFCCSVLCGCRGFLNRAKALLMLVGAFVPCLTMSINLISARSNSLYVFPCSLLSAFTFSLASAPSLERIGTVGLSSVIRKVPYIRIS